MSNEFRHCDEERGSNLTDLFLLEVLGLLFPCGRNDSFEFFAVGC